MSETLDLFRDRPPAQLHSRTSTEAALDVAARVPALEARVLAFLRERGDEGATDEEIQRGLAMNPSTERPRRIWLCGTEGRKALVVDSGRTRKTLSKRNATVWVAVP